MLHVYSHRNDSSDNMMTPDVIRTADDPGNKEKNTWRKLIKISKHVKNLLPILDFFTYIYLTGIHSAELIHSELHFRTVPRKFSPLQFRLL